MELQALLRFTILSASVATLVACSSADTATTPTTPPTTSTPVTISGSVFASPVSQATVTIKDGSGNTVAGPILAETDGTYSVDILDTDLAGDLVFESSGGEFTDEETGSVNVVAGAMSAFVEGGSLAAGSSVHVTPDTTIHADLITKYNKTPTAAQTAFFNAFAHNPDFSVEPVDITDPASSNADDASKHAGWRAAVFSRMANTLTLAPADQFDMFAAIAQDLSDDSMDGMDASGPVQIGSTSINAPVLADYITATSSFDTAEAANLKVTYTPPMMNVHGKNVFTLTITDTSGTPVTGLTAAELKVMPMMYMADRTHATPMGGITELGNGVYEVTAYYLMPSRMMDGTTMGTWDLKVMANMKTVHFYPNINMAMMTNTVRVQLKGVNDTIINMDGLEVPRPYNLFRDNLVQQGSGTDYDFDIFIAPMENMMSFPALIDGMTLTSGMDGTPYDVTGITAEASDDDGASWTAGTPGVTDGVWSFSTLQLSSGTNTIKVRLTVSSEVKTTDGLAAVTDVNDFTTFTVTLP
jgi:hypothetical protein